MVFHALRLQRSLNFLIRLVCSLHSPVIVVLEINYASLSAMRALRRSTAGTDRLHTSLQLRKVQEV